MTDWMAITERNARSVQTLIGWIFWDPGVDERMERLGLPKGVGYVGGRAAPLMPAGNDAVIAAFYSISPKVLSVVLDLVREKASADEVWEARNQAVVEGLRRYVPELCEPLGAMAGWLWEAAGACPLEGRVFYGAHLRMPRPDDPVLSAWHAVNCIREWRGDTHWALLVANEVGPAEAGILHNAWVGYEKDWVPASRFNTADEIAQAWASLEARGLASGREVSGDGLEFRQHLEDETNRLTTIPWESAGEESAVEFARVLEPPCEVLLGRVDETAGPNYMPASRIHHRRRG